MIRATKTTNLESRSSFWHEAVSEARCYAEKHLSDASHDVTEEKIFVVIPTIYSGGKQLF